MFLTWGLLGGRLDQASKDLKSIFPLAVISLTESFIEIIPAFASSSTNPKALSDCKTNHLIYAFPSVKSSI